MNIPETEWENIVITTAMLLGAPEPEYNDFGHPERAMARKYWKIALDSGPVAYGHTRADAFSRWLWLKGFKVQRSNGNTIKVHKWGTT